MLLWRLISGAVSVAVLVLLCWFDHSAGRPGLALLPLALVVCAAATQEVRALVFSSPTTSASWSLYAATLTTVALSGFPCLGPVGNVAQLGWLASGVTAGLLILLVHELCRYEPDGVSLDRLARGAFTVVYVGGSLGWIVQLRLGPIAAQPRASWGMLAFVSLVTIVKAGDIGAFVLGHLCGRHKLAPKISPGKTWEGLVGGLIASGFAAWLSVAYLPDLFGLGALSFGPGWLVFALLLALAGLAGDLAESMLKRSAGVKDSSSWLLGLGGVLDMLDSLLVAAPIAYLGWSLGLVGP